MQSLAPDHILSLPFQRHVPPQPSSPSQPSLPSQPSKPPPATSPTCKKRPRALLEVAEVEAEAPKEVGAAELVKEPKAVEHISKEELEAKLEELRRELRLSKEPVPKQPPLPPRQPSSPPPASACPLRHRHQIRATRVIGFARFATTGIGPGAATATADMASAMPPGMQASPRVIGIAATGPTI